MTSPHTIADRLLVLRVMGGSHSGAEAVLEAGHYMVGSASYCEVLLRDDNVPEVALIVLAQGPEVIVRDLSDGSAHEVTADGLGLRVTPAVALLMATGYDEAAIRGKLDQLQASWPEVDTPIAAPVAPITSPGLAARTDAPAGISTSRKISGIVAISLTVGALSAAGGWFSARLWEPAGQQVAGHASAAKALRIIQESGISELRVATDGTDSGLRLVGYVPTMAAVESLERRFAQANLKVDARSSVHVIEQMVERVRTMAAPSMSGRAAEVRHVGGGVVEILTADCAGLKGAAALAVGAPSTVAGLRQLTVAAPAQKGCGTQTDTAADTKTAGKNGADPHSRQVRVAAVVPGVYFEAGGTRYLQGGAYGPWQIERIESDGVVLVHPGRSERIFVGIDHPEVGS